MLSNFNEILWITLIALEWVALAAAIARKIHRDYPILVSYIAFCAIRSVALRIMGYGSAAYFYSYWIGQGFEAVVLIGLLWELARPIILPIWIIPKDSRNYFYFSLYSVLAIALLLPAWSHDGPFHLEQWYWLAVLRCVSRTAYLIMFGFSLMACALTVWLDIPWQRRSFIVTLGLLANFGISAWFWFLDQSVVTSAAHNSLLWIDSSATLVAFVTWTIAFCVKEYPAPELTKQELDSLEHLMSSPKGGRTENGIC